MRKKIVILAMILVIVSLTFVLSACNEEEVLTIEKITVEYNKKVAYKVGSQFSTEDFTVTAHLSDDTTKEIKNNLIWHTETLGLDDEDKFQNAGEYTLKVDFLKYKDLEVTIVVGE